MEWNYEIARLRTAINPIDYEMEERLAPPRQIFVDISKSMKPLNLRLGDF